jgi:tRNA threonylcarbamoyl adenosine modification protein (Sua5/YciO/YrdC/YwlC family)
MHEYVVQSNIDDRSIKKAVNSLNSGALIALPTDTSWVIACSFQSKDGIKKLRQLSRERDENHFTLLCSDISQFGNFCIIDNQRFRFIKKLSPGPFVFILNTLHGTGKTLGRNELGVRIPNNPIARSVVAALGSPLYSITAKKYMTKVCEDTEHVYDDILEEELFENGYELDDIKDVSLILDPGEDLQRVFSTVLDLTNDDVKVVRQGAGIFSE